MKKKATIKKSAEKNPKQFFPSLVKRKFCGIEIDIRSPRSLYIGIGDHLYYIDDTTGEQICQVWHKSDQE